MDDLISEFVEETTEALSDVEKDLLAMEQNPEAEHDVGNLFRLVHTIKGTCSFIGLDRLGALAHAAEDILGKVRDREMTLSPEAVSVILEALDVVGQLLEFTSENGHEPDIDVGELIARLNMHANGDGVAADRSSMDADAVDTTSADYDDWQESQANPALETESDDADPAPVTATGNHEGGPPTLADILGLSAGSGAGDDEGAFNDTMLPDAADDSDKPADDCAFEPAVHDEPIEKGPLSLAEILAGATPVAEVQEDAHAEPLTEPEDEPAPSVKSISDILAHAEVQKRGQSAPKPAASGTSTRSVAEPLTLAKILAQCGPGKKPQPVPDAITADRTPEEDAGGRTGDAAFDSPCSADIQIEKTSKQTTTGAPPATETTDGTEKNRKGAQAGASLRVNVGLLEHMMTLVGELVLTRNQLSQLAKDNANNAFDIPLQRLHQVSVELQEGVMKTRMQPIGNAWNKLPRIVRDLAKDLGKKIELDMQGAETELDRQVLELIKDPLTHMVRNSADHGIESLERRRAVGKPDVGTVRLEAAHKESHIVITLSDDGGGLDAAAIRNRVIDRGLAKPEEAEAMSEHQLHQYIFAPGFSTAAAVTSVSGRGVGMDVVRTNIEKIGGSVSLESEIGKGTCFTIRIPLTLAILPVLIVGNGTERFALPQINLHEVLQVRDKNSSGIEEVSGSILYRYRDDLIPLVDLAEICGHPRPDDEAKYFKKFVAVCKFSNMMFGLICDSIFESDEIIAKPVASILKGMTYFSGNAILGDGTAIFILDANALATKVHLNHIDDAPRTREEDTPSAENRPTFQMIIFECINGTRKALPISLVERVEEIASEDLEQIDQRIVVQYEGKLMPVLDIDDDGLRDSQMHSVIVFRDNDSYLGMRIARICDIAELEINTDIEGKRPGCLGATVSEGQVIEILDVDHMMSSCFPHRYGPYASRNVGKRRRSTEILLVDDSRFFRNFISPFLQMSGYQVTVVERPKDALEILERNSEFAAVISDIEMPEMDGYGFLRSIRGRDLGANLPVIALSSHGSKSDIARGLDAGFDAYVSKTDKAGLLEALRQVIEPMKKAS